MKLSDEELVAAIEAEERTAIDAQDTDLASSRAEASARYRGEMPELTVVDGRSSVVSRDVMDTIQWVVPQLARVFLGGEEIGKFEPVGPEDEQAAEIETQVVNWMLQNKSDLYSNVISTITDALLLRNGYLAAYWANDADITTETYTGLADEEAAMLVSDPEVEVVEHSEYPDPLMAAMPQQPGPDGMPMPMALLHDIKVERKVSNEYVGVESIPPDEIVVSRRQREVSLANADFVQWRRRVTIGQLRAEGFKVPDDALEYSDLSEEREMRERFWASYNDEDATGDITRRVVLCKDTYLRIDLGDKGTPQLWRVVIIDGMSTPVLKEEADCIPFAAFSPLIYPHSHVGTSLDDLVKDLALIKTVMQRQLVDGVFLQNSGRVAANVDMVNVDDLLVSRPGGIVRVMGSPSDALFPLVTPDAGPTILSSLEYLEGVKEGRTGVTRYSAGLDANTLNKTATGVQAIQSAANQRIELIARTMANGFRDLFLVAHTLLSKHSTKPLQIKLRGQWQAIDPRAWAKRTDFSISVGLGTGSPEVQMQKLMLIGQVMQQGQALGVVGPEEYLNWFDDLCKAAGYRNPRRFSQEVQKDPQTGKAQMPPPQKPELVQAQEVKASADTQMNQQKLAADVQKFQAETERLERLERIRAEESYKEALLEAATKLLIANKEATLQQQQMAMDLQRQQEEKEEAGETRRTEAAESLQPLMAAVEQMAAALTAPKVIVRDPGGKVIGLRRG